MATYGIGYMGSKSRIAKEICNCFPFAKHFYDLFGGGFAISHYMVLHRYNDYDNFYYNDVDSLIIDYVKDAIAGKYNADVFAQEFITRDEFHKRKYTDGYVKFCWSFGNRGYDYLYGKKNETIKELEHKKYIENADFMNLIFSMTKKNNIIVR